MIPLAASSSWVTSQLVKCFLAGNTESRERSGYLGEHGHCLPDPEEPQDEAEVPKEVVVHDPLWAVTEAVVNRLNLKRIVWDDFLTAISIAASNSQVFATAPSWNISQVVKYEKQMQIERTGAIRVRESR